MKASKRGNSANTPVEICADVTRRIRQHGRSSLKAEICGVLIGDCKDSQVTVRACIPGVNASQGGAHVTFTQETWEHIYKVKDEKYPEQRIIGWYHSHPGFGVFLSEHDEFIQKNFFSAPEQIAWVYDPHTDEEGCFGWRSGRIERLSELQVRDEGLSRDGTHEPKINGEEEHQEAAAETEYDLPNAHSRPGWFLRALSYAAVMLLGAVLAFFLFPRIVFVPVNPFTGKIMRPEELPQPPALSAPNSSSPKSGEKNNPGASK
jgi:proteasome lid subunit RPN8/RPN11